MSGVGARASRWLTLGADAPDGILRIILADVDGVITRGEGLPLDPGVLERLTAINRRAVQDARVPAITLCTGRQAPYVELMAQAIDGFLPCIFEHGAGLFFPDSFEYQLSPRLGADHWTVLARLRACLHEVIVKSGRGFVQPGKEATVTLFPVGDTTVAQLADFARAVVHQSRADFRVIPNVSGVELLPPGIDKGHGARRLSEMLGIPLAAMAGVGDSDPDLSYLRLVGSSAAPANATPTVREAVDYVAHDEFGAGLLEIVMRVERRNRNTL